MEDFYENELVDYNKNYNSSISKVDKIINALENLYKSFDNASGIDIDNIRKDITNLKKELLNIKKKINSCKDKTNDRAESSKRCFIKYNNKSYPAEKKDNRDYVAGAYVYIDKTTGLIVVQREYTRIKGFIEGLLLPSAGEYYDNNTIRKEEMFNS